MSAKPHSLDPAKIAKIADDIRLIKDFAENRGFDPTLLNANVTPSTGRKLDWPFISLTLSILTLLITLAAITFWELPPKALKYLTLVGILSIVIATISAHKKFEDSTITMVTGFGLCILLAIGTNIFTTKEVVEKLQDKFGVGEDNKEDKGNKKDDGDKGDKKGKQGKEK